MTEVSETPQPERSVLDREPPAPQLVGKLTGIAFKALGPTLATGVGVDTKRYPGYALLQHVSAVAEIAAIQQTTTGRELGPAMYLAARFTSLLSETIVRRREKKGEKKSRRSEDERFPVRVPALVSAVAAKLLLPTFLSARSAEGRFAKAAVDTAQLAEIGAGVSLGTGHQELAGILFVVGRSTALLTEVSEDLVKRYGDTIRRTGSELEQKISVGAKELFGKSSDVSKKFVGSVRDKVKKPADTSSSRRALKKHVSEFLKGLFGEEEE